MPKKIKQSGGLQQAAEEDGPPPSESGASCSRPELASDEIRDKLGLPESYRIKYRRLCAKSSLHKAEYQETAAWGDLIAWGNGTRVAPSGVFCRQVFLNKQGVAASFHFANHIHLTR